MHPKSPKPLTLMALTAAAWMAPSFVAPSSQAMAQPAPVASRPHLIPQALRIEHKETLEQVSLLAKRKGPVGTEAGKVLVLLKQHMAREETFILPPLTLLPLLADGKVTPDMAWALPMTERLRADREEIFEEHTRITDALNGLIVAALRAHDNDAKEFAETAAADSLTDLEIFQPTLLLIGDILRSKLPAGH
jgi:hypothetical protein